MLKDLHENLSFGEISLSKKYCFAQNVVTLPTRSSASEETQLPFKAMHNENTNIPVRRTMRHWLRDSITILTEALIWTGCVYAATLLQEPKADAGTPPSHVWLVLFGWGIAFLFVVTRFIPSNVFSRTARRDEIVAQAMKTVLAFTVLSLAAFTERTGLQLYACLFFGIALTLERLILNSLFIRYSIRHCEHAVILCNEETAWQQQALRQNTYGLKLERLETPTPQQLADYLAAHPETENVYCAPSSMQATEFEGIAHICHKQGVTLRIMPLAPCALPQTMQAECRGSVNVLSPATPPLQTFAGRATKRLTDIVLSLLVLLTVFPIFGLIAFIYIKRQSRGPALITRHMCGMDGKTFQSLTFRTRHYEAAPSFLDGINDPGYFPFGKFLTHSRWEQLPQFLCVLWGSMTIVGSQTMRPEHYADYLSEQKQLFADGYRLKAGITGYRFAPQTEGSTKADVWYFRNWGFWLDIRIMLQRIGTLLSKSKAKSIQYI